MHINQGQCVLDVINEYPVFFLLPPPSFTPPPPMLSFYMVHRRHNYGSVYDVCVCICFNHILFDTRRWIIGVGGVGAFSEFSIVLLLLLSRAMMIINCFLWWWWRPATCGFSNKKINTAKIQREEKLAARTPPQLQNTKKKILVLSLFVCGSLYVDMNSNKQNCARNIFVETKTNTVKLTIFFNSLACCASSSDRAVFLNAVVCWLMVLKILFWSYIFEAFRKKKM